MDTGIFFDIDGTLRDNDTSIVPQSAARALRRLRDAGYILGIATGRTIYEVEDNIRDLIDWDVFVCDSGQLVCGKNYEVIYVNFVPEPIVRKCVGIAAKMGKPLQLTTVEKVFLTGPLSESDFKLYCGYDVPVPVIEEYCGQPVMTVMVIGYPGYDFHEYRALEGVTTYPGLFDNIDLVPEGASKHSGIVKALEHLGLKNYIAFGDAVNDLEMLKNATVSVAMGGSVPEAAEAADYHTANVLDDGIEKACHALKLY